MRLEQAAYLHLTCTSPAPHLHHASNSPSAGVEDIAPLEVRLKEAGIEYTRSMSGRPAIFFRDPGELLSAAVVCGRQVVWHW